MDTITTSRPAPTTPTPTTCCRDPSTTAIWCRPRPGLWPPNSRRRPRSIRSSSSSRTPTTVTRTWARRSRPTRPCSTIRYRRRRSPFSRPITRCPPTGGRTARRAVRGLPPTLRCPLRQSTRSRRRRWVTWK